MIGTHEFHLSIHEVNTMIVGEMVDMINHLSVYKGTAKFKPRKLTYDEVMRLR